jgi:hypothetical protein
MDFVRTRDVHLNMIGCHINIPRLMPRIKSNAASDDSFSNIAKKMISFEQDTCHMQN